MEHYNPTDELSEIIEGDNGKNESMSINLLYDSEEAQSGINDQKECPSQLFSDDENRDITHNDIEESSSIKSQNPNSDVEQDKDIQNINTVSSNASKDLLNELKDADLMNTIIPATPEEASDKDLNELKDSDLMNTIIPATPNEAPDKCLLNVLKDADLMNTVIPATLNEAPDKGLLNELKDADLMNTIIPATPEEATDKNLLNELKDADLMNTIIPGIPKEAPDKGLLNELKDADLVNVIMHATPKEAPDKCLLNELKDADLMNTIIPGPPKEATDKGLLNELEDADLMNTIISASPKEAHDKITDQESDEDNFSSNLSKHSKKDECYIQEQKEILFKSDLKKDDTKDEYGIDANEDGDNTSEVGLTVNLSSPIFDDEFSSDGQKNIKAIKLDSCSEDSGEFSNHESEDNGRHDCNMAKVEKSEEKEDASSWNKSQTEVETSKGCETGNSNIKTDNHLPKSKKINKIVFDLGSTGPNEISGTDIQNGSFSRIIIIGDTYVSQLARAWPESSNFKPYFIWKNSLDSKHIFNIMKKNKFIKKSGKSLVIILLSLDGLLVYKKLECDLWHTAIEFPLHVVNKSIVLHIIEKMKETLGHLDSSANFHNCTFIYGGYPYAKLTHKIEEARSYDESLKCDCNYAPKKNLIVTNTFLANTVHVINTGIYNRGFSSLSKYKHFRLPSFYVQFNKGNWNIIDDCVNDFVLKLHDHLQFCLCNIKSDQMLLLSSNKSDEANIEDKGIKSLKDASIYFFGNSWLKNVAKSWAFKSELKPYIFTSQVMKIEDIETFVMSDIHEDEEALIIACIGVNEFFRYQSFSRCSGHKPLVYPVLKESIRKNPKEFISAMHDRLLAVLQNLASCRKKCKLVFMTCYPAILNEYYTFLISTHSRVHQISNSEKNRYFKTTYNDEKTKSVFSMVNDLVFDFNKANGLHTCDIYDLLLHLTKQNNFTFPQYVPHISPSPAVTSKLTDLIHEYLISIDSLAAHEELDLFKPSEELLSLKKDAFQCKDTSSDSFSKIETKNDLVITIKNRHEPIGFPDHDHDNVDDENLDLDDIIVSSSSEFLETVTDPYGRKLSSSYAHRSEYDQRQESARDKDTFPSEPSVSHSRYHYQDRDERYMPHGSKHRFDQESRRKRYSEDSHYNRSPSYPGHSRCSPYRHSRRSPSPYYRKEDKCRSRSKKYGSKRSLGRSRSRSPSYRHSKRGRHDDEGLSSKVDRSVEHIALTSLRGIHERECIMYRNNPEAHPDYNRERRLWEENLRLMGCNPFTPIQYNDWRNFWQKKMEIIFESTWEEKKKNCLDLLPTTSRSSQENKSISRHSRSSYSRSRSRSTSRSKKYSRNRKKSRRTRSSSIDSSSSSHGESLAAINKLQKKIDKFMEKAAVKEKFDENTFDMFKNLPIETKLKEVVQVLHKMTDKFGALSTSVQEMHHRVLHAASIGRDILECLDGDSLILFGLINDKLEHMLSSPHLTLVQKGITGEVKKKVSNLIESYKRKKDPYFGLSISHISKSTSGFITSNVIAFIKNSLKYNHIDNYSEEDLMKIYLAVKSCQLNLESNRDRYSQDSLLHSSAQASTSTVAFPPPIASCSRLLFQQSYAPKRNPPPAPRFVNSFRFSHSLSNTVNLNKNEERRWNKEERRKEFLNLSLTDKIKKFVNFANLPFEEKNLLITHLEELEKDDKELATSLRILITNKLYVP